MFSAGSGQDLVELLLGDKCIVSDYFEKLKKVQFAGFSI